MAKEVNRPQNKARGPSSPWPQLRRPRSVGGGLGPERWWSEVRAEVAAGRLVLLQVDITELEKDLRVSQSQGTPSPQETKRVTAAFHRKGGTHR